MSRLSFVRMDMHLQNGWVKIHRKILDNPVCSKASWAWLWVVLLLKANHEEKSFFFNGQKITCGKGQLVTGREALAEAASMSPSSVERALTYFESEHQIEQQKTKKYRVITILKWADYQTPDSKADNKRTTDGQLMDTNKNDKNDKKDKKYLAAHSAADVVAVVDAFAEVNPTYRQWYKNTTQRDAISRLVEIHGLERLLSVVHILPRSNEMPYVPTVTTPRQLEEKWAALEAALRKEKAKLTKATNNVLTI